MAVELWDDDAGNWIEDFESVEKALAFVHETIVASGQPAVRNWSIGAIDGSFRLSGSDLIERAMAVPV